MAKINGYSLSRKWWDFAFENSRCKCYHSALYHWIVELNNRLGWKSEFGLPTNNTMEILSIGNKNTYLSTLRDLETWGFIQVVKEAKNQYQSCIIKLCHSESDPAQDTPLHTSLLQHNPSTGNIIGAATDTIDKQENTETIKPIKIEFDVFWDLYSYKKDKPACEKLWQKIGDEDRKTIINNLPAYIKSTPDKTYRKNPKTYLNNRSWENEILDLPTTLLVSNQTEFSRSEAFVKNKERKKLQTHE